MGLTPSRVLILTLCLALPASTGCAARAPDVDLQRQAALARAPLSAADDALLEDLSKRSFMFFWEQADPTTGIVRDRSRTDGTPVDGNARDVGSIAAVGFGLAGLCIAAERGWVPRPAAIERTRVTLRFFAERSEHQRGWFYHFINIRTGAREWASELSSIDTALLLAGVLTVRQCFAGDAEIPPLADAIYRRVDFTWMLAGDPLLLSHGWKPESGFLTSRWDHYCELMVLYLLAIGSPTHPIPAAVLAGLAPPGDHVRALLVRRRAAAALRASGTRTPGWISAAVREREPPHTDWWQNSVDATRAHKAFMLELAKEFPGYTEHIWGVTASDSRKGYVAWGGPAARRPASTARSCPARPPVR